MTDFHGLHAIVTGGASGIGAATAVLLHQRGAQVAVLDRSVDGAPGEFLAVPCDVTDLNARERGRASLHVQVNVIGLHGGEGGGG